MRDLERGAKGDEGQNERKQVQTEKEKLVGQEMRDRERIMKGTDKQWRPRGEEIIRRDAERGEEQTGRVEESKGTSNFVRVYCM